MSSSSTNSIVIGDQTYNLTQFHLHTPSEHTVEGAEDIPLSQLSFGDLAVLGVMVTEGKATNAFIGNNKALKLDQIVPRNEQVEFIFNGIEINPANLLPTKNSDGNRPFYRYNGSLTTPPCSELVLWSVFREPITMSKRQIRVFREALSNLRFAGLDGENDRPTQPLNGRQVLLGDSSD